VKSRLEEEVAGGSMEVVEAEWRRCEEEEEDE
jgi:hypothetical protein